MEKNFENEMKRRLGERSLEPQPNAWERVALQRGQQKKNTTYIYYWIAAALVIGIGLTFLRFDDKVPTTNPEIIVDRPEESAIPDSVKVFEHRVRQKVVAVNEPEVVTKSDSDNKTETPIAIRQPQIVIEPTIETRQNPIEQQKIQEILVAVDDMIKAGKQPDEDDVDLLIEKARREIAAGNGLSKQTDANALLKDSESELNESFRSGIFESLFKQKRIKIAFSNK
ncbi:MAG: hypothetical protein EOO50_10705 [Flavobacterium sp.]|uniref:hypothetical protein n=1 Tax=Flavobacterium sp. TaxID=239 RepID=UPI0012168755|nr:hypothetical protein [Flavobacterium sp.]RZJ66254.1 MAG: hypothetical protein EOO50_10705 [Flavobacterium sp.]